ncbi:MAG: hypothetical protein ACK5NI_02160, partial [bacterium]
AIIIFLLLQISLFAVPAIGCSCLIHTVVIILSIPSNWLSTLSYILCRVQKVFLDIHAIRSV